MLLDAPALGPINDCVDAKVGPDRIGDIIAERDMPRYSVLDFASGLAGPIGPRSRSLLHAMMNSPS